MIPSGTVLIQRYRVERLVGQGGMGAVYEAIDERLLNRVALKQLTVQREILSRAFKREARMLANIDHPALPHVIDHFSDPLGEFLVMQFFAGPDLAALQQERDQPFPIEQVVTWGDQILSALEYLHGQEPPIIHRDIKPQNLKLKANGDIVLLDFGLAKGATFEVTRIVSSLSGYTPGYASPEQLEGLGTDQRSDLYSVAAALHQFLTNRPPVDVTTRLRAAAGKRPDPLLPAHELNPNVPLALSALIQQALALEPSDRPASATAMRAALRLVLRDDMTVVETGGTVAPNGAQTVARRRTFRRWFALGATILAIMLAVTWFSWSAARSSTASIVPTQTSIDAVAGAALVAPTKAATVLPTEASAVSTPSVVPAPLASAEPTIAGVGMVPTITSAPTETASPTPEPTPTDTSTPEPTPTDTSTPEPTPTATETSTPEPTVTPRPTLTPLPTAPPTEQPAFEPSPSMGRLAFATNYRDDDWYIEVLDLDAGERQVLEGTGGDINIDPVWSPDGSQIAFTNATETDRDVWVMNADGSAARRVSSDSADELYPSWSPDSSALIYTHAIENKPPSKLYLTSIDGSDVRQLGEGERGTFNNQGEILYSYGYPRPRDIWVMDGDGTNQRQLTDTPKINEEFAVWSPDGSRIAYVANPNEGNYTADLDKRQIWTMNADGSDHRQLTSGTTPFANPAWSPDGRSIAYLSQQTGPEWQIWIMRADGSQKRQITDDAGRKFYLSWTGAR